MCQESLLKVFMKPQLDRRHYRHQASQSGQWRNEKRRRQNCPPDRKSPLERRTTQDWRGLIESCSSKTKAICQKVQNFEDLEIELQECKGILKGKRRKELQGKIEQTKKQLESMKRDLTYIVTSSGFQNVWAFQQEYEKSKSEYGWYRQASNDWERAYGKGREQQPKSNRARLKRNEEQIKQRERNRTSASPKKRQRSEIRRER